MASQVFKRGQSELSFNMTPMIDVVFLLLIFFMLVTQFASVENKRLQLPTDCASASEEVKPKLKYVINLTAGDEPGKLGEVFVGPVRVPPGREGREMLTANLKAAVEAAKKKNAEVTVILRADAHIHYGYVSKIMEACAQANVRNIQIAAIRPMERKINGKALQ